MSRPQTLADRLCEITCDSAGEVHGIEMERRWQGGQRFFKLSDLVEATSSSIADSVQAAGMFVAWLAINRLTSNFGGVKHILSAYSVRFGSRIAWWTRIICAV